MPRPQPYIGAEEEIYAFYLGYYEDHKIPPLIKEVTEHWNQTHEVKVTDGFTHRYVTKLVWQGKLVRRTTSDRRWTLPDDPLSETNTSSYSGIPGDAGASREHADGMH